MVWTRAFGTAAFHWNRHGELGFGIFAILGVIGLWAGAGLGSIPGGGGEGWRHGCGHWCGQLGDGREAAVLVVAGHLERDDWSTVLCWPPSWLHLLTHSQSAIITHIQSIILSLGEQDSNCLCWIKGLLYLPLGIWVVNIRFGFYTLWLQRQQAVFSSLANLEYCSQRFKLVLNKLRKCTLLCIP